MPSTPKTGAKSCRASRRALSPCAARWMNSRRRWDTPPKVAASRFPNHFRRIFVVSECNEFGVSQVMGPVHSKNWIRATTSGRTLTLSIIFSAVSPWPHRPAVGSGRLAKGHFDDFRCLSDRRPHAVLQELGLPSPGLRLRRKATHLDKADAVFGGVSFIPHRKPSLVPRRSADLFAFYSPILSACRATTDLATVSTCHSFPQGMAGPVPRSRPEDSSSQDVHVHRSGEDPRAGQAR